MKQKLRKDFVLNSVNFFFISLFNYIFKMIEDTFISSYAIVVIVSTLHRKKSEPVFFYIDVKVTMVT